VVVTRMMGRVVFPARFTLVAAILQAMQALRMSHERSRSSASARASRGVPLDSAKGRSG
jgi:hypothetical protein